MFFDFPTKTAVPNVLQACLASNSMIWVHKGKESLSTQSISKLPQVIRGILQSCTLRCCTFKLFLLIEELFDAKYWLLVML